MLYIKEVEESRRAAEKALQDELSLKTSAKKRAAGKGQDPKRDSKKKANKPAKDAESASDSDSRFKERLSHSNRQLQAMASQVRALGAVPVFVKRPGSAGSEKARAATTKAVVAATGPKVLTDQLKQKQKQNPRLMQNPKINPNRLHLKRKICRT